MCQEINHQIYQTLSDMIYLPINYYFVKKKKINKFYILNLGIFLSYIELFIWKRSVQSKIWLRTSNPLSQLCSKTKCHQQWEYKFFPNNM